MEGMTGCGSSAFGLHHDCTRGSTTVSDRPIAPNAFVLGFLSVVQDPGGYFGGYLVTNAWGRPLEFRMTTAVQPNRVQQILYGATLNEYIFADLIGKTLIDKATAQPSLIIADHPSMLPLRSRMDVPVIALPGDTPGDALTITHARSSSPLLFSASFAHDRATIEDLLNQIDPSVDLTEPFARIREAVAEARKLGVANRAA